MGPPYDPENQELFATPRAGPAEQDGIVGDSSCLLFDPAVVQIVKDHDGTHTELSDKFDGRMSRMALAVANYAPEASGAAVKFLIEVEQIAAQYQALYGAQMSQDGSGSDRLPMHQWAEGLIRMVDPTLFEELEHLKHDPGNSEISDRPLRYLLLRKAVGEISHRPGF